MTVRIPTHPTASIRRSLDESGWSVDEFVARMGISRDTASHILSGRGGITPEVALALERIGWSTADFWMRRQAAYDLATARRGLEGAAILSPPELPPSAAIPDAQRCHYPERGGVMTAPTIDNLFNLLDEWRHFPKYRLEPRADPFFAMFLPDVLEAHYGCEFNREVIPEFPLRHGTLGTNKTERSRNLSVNVDYAAFTKNDQKVFFVELKTDVKSRDPDQDSYLKKATGFEFKTLVDGIPLIKEKSKQGGKYARLLDRLEELGVNGIAHKPKVVYIQPHSNKADHKGHADYIYFDEIAKVVKTHGEIGERFARSLCEWAKVEAGAHKP